MSYNLQSKYYETGRKTIFTCTVRKVVPYRKRKPSNIIRTPLYSIIYIKYKTFLPTPVTQHIEIPRQITCVFPCSRVHFSSSTFEL